MGFTDNFNRADDCLGPNWTVGTGFPSISGNKVTGNGAPRVSQGIVRSADYYAEAVVTPGAGGGGPSVRDSSIPGVTVASDGLTMYFAYLSGGTLTLYKWVAGALTSIGSAGGIAAGAHTIRLAATGTSLVASVDGVSTVNVTDSSVAAAGTPGMYFDAPATFDNFATSAVFVTDIRAARLVNGGLVA